MDIAGLAQFPGGALVERGIRDLGEGRQSTEALLVTIGAGRLRVAGVPVPRVAIVEPDGVGEPPAFHVASSATRCARNRVIAVGPTGPRTSW